MSEHPDRHLNHTDVAMAALTVCIVQTLGEGDPSFQQRFKDNIQNMYSRARNNNMFDDPALETIGLVRDLLKQE